MEALHVGGGRPRPSSHSQQPSAYSSQAASSLVSAAPASASASDGDGNGGPEVRGLDINLGALCDHVQLEGWKSRAFSDIVVKAMGHTFHLHRLLLSRSSYFRNMLQGPWKEAGAHEVTLQIDDENVNGDAVATALAYLYGHYPKLDDSNAFRVLAAGSFLDLQDLCALCTNFIISELWTENFLAYQAFAESQDYGVHGEHVRKACWGYLCRGGAVELREILPKLSTQTLSLLLTSDELWVPSEEKRFELALSVLLARGVVLEMPQLSSSLSPNTSAMDSDGTPSPVLHKSQQAEEILEKSSSRVTLTESDEVIKTMRGILMELMETVVENMSANHSCLSTSKSPEPSTLHHLEQGLGGVSRGTYDQVIHPLVGKPLRGVDSSQSIIEIRKNGEACTSEDTCPTPEQVGFEGVELGFCEQFTYEEAWRPPRAGDQLDQGCRSPLSHTSASSTCAKILQDQWSSACPSLSWGGRVVERRLKKACPNTRDWCNTEDWEAFLGIFERGGVLYCHMAFEDLLYMRGRLEELGFPCKSVADSLWLQTLLRQQVLTIAADTCKNCSLIYVNCSCRQFNPSYSHGRIPGVHYRDENQDRAAGPVLTGSYSGPEGLGGAGANMQSPGRVHTRNAMDGLAGIGRGTTFGPAGVWPAPRFLYIPALGAYGGRGGTQQSGVGSNQLDGRSDLSETDLPAHSRMDSLTAAASLSQGGPGVGNGGAPGQSDLTGRVEEESPLSAKPAGLEPSCNIVLQKSIPQESNVVCDWEGCEGASIQLDLHTPLRSFPQFRFGVEFDDVHRLGDGQSKHSPEAFYAGSLWKVSVQAFNDEDPRGRRTLGLFLHRRKAEDVGPHRKVSFYVDTREKVTARYQLICPAKREVLILGSPKQAGTLLPKAPKGWGWRTAFLFDDLPNLLQGGSLRVAAVVQLV
ncbi:unnamed protein product [Sphagnum tenellum]